MEDYEDIRHDLVRKREEMLGRLSAIVQDVGHLSQPLDPDFEEQAVERMSALLQQHGSPHQVRLVRSPRNQGKGG